MLSQIVMTVSLVFAALIFGIFADRGETAGKATVKPTKKKVLPKGTKILGTVEPVHYALIPRASTLVLPDLRLEEIPSFVPTTLRKREAKALEAKSSLAEVQTHKMKEMDAVESTGTSELEANVMAFPLEADDRVEFFGDTVKILAVTESQGQKEYRVELLNVGGEAFFEGARARALEKAAEDEAAQLKSDAELKSLRKLLAESEAQRVAQASANTKADEDQNPLSKAMKALAKVKEAKEKAKSNDLFEVATDLLPEIERLEALVQTLLDLAAAKKALTETNDGDQDDLLGEIIRLTAQKKVLQVDAAQKKAEQEKLDREKESQKTAEENRALRAKVEKDANDAGYKFTRQFKLSTCVVNCRFTALSSTNFIVDVALEIKPFVANSVAMENDLPRGLVTFRRENGEKACPDETLETVRLSTGDVGSTEDLVYGDYIPLNRKLVIAKVKVSELLQNKATSCAKERLGSKGNAQLVQKKEEVDQQTLNP